MEHLDKLINLAECDGGFVGICECCASLNLLYNNIAIKFKEDEFEYFRSYMNTLNPDDYIYESRAGKNIFMKSPVRNIVFCFSKSEIEELRDLLNQANLMLSAYKILN